MERHEKQQLRSLLEQFEDVLSVIGGDLGHSELVYLIDTGDAELIRQPARRFLFHQKKLRYVVCWM